jgi:hypothetical protein
MIPDWKRRRNDNVNLACLNRIYTRLFIHSVEVERERELMLVSGEKDVQIPQTEKLLSLAVGRLQTVSTYVPVLVGFVVIDANCSVSDLVDTSAEVYYRSCRTLELLNDLRRVWSRQRIVSVVISFFRVLSRQKFVPSESCYVAWSEVGEFTYATYCMYLHTRSSTDSVVR